MYNWKQRSCGSIFNRNNKTPVTFALNAAKIPLVHSEQPSAIIFSLCYQCFIDVDMGSAKSYSNRVVNVQSAKCKCRGSTKCKCRGSNFSNLPPNQSSKDSPSLALYDNIARSTKLISDKLIEHTYGNVQIKAKNGQCVS